MKQIKFVGLVSCLLCSLLSCSQTKPLVQNTHAYFSVRMPGTIRVDELGNPQHAEPNVLTMVYVETKNDAAITWTLAQQKGKLYSVIATRIEKIPFSVGTEKATGKSIVLTPARGNSLWQLELVPNDNKITPLRKKNGEGILLQGEIHKRKFTTEVYGATELVVPDAV